MFSMIRQRRASFSHVNSIGIQKNSFNSFEFYHFAETLALFSHCLIEFNSDPIKDYFDHILRKFSLYNPIVLDYLWDLLNSVIGKNCNLFRNISKSFPELSNFITQSLNIESHRPFRYAKSAFENFSPFSIFDRYSFTFLILYSAVYFSSSILVPIYIQKSGKYSDVSGYYRKHIKDGRVKKLERYRKSKRKYP